MLFPRGLRPNILNRGGGGVRILNGMAHFPVSLEKSRDSKVERLFHRFEDLDVHFFGGRVFCRVFSFHLEFHKGVFIVKGVNEHIENFNSEPCGRHFGHLLFSKERETGDQFGRTIQPGTYNPNMGCLLTPKYG